MKNWKYYGIISFLLILFLMLIFIACDDPSEKSKNQNYIIENLFGDGYFLIVEGYLTDNEWNGVSDKIKVSIEEAFQAQPTPFDMYLFSLVFSENDIKIIIEKHSNDYIKWKTSDDGKTMYLKYSELNNALKYSIMFAVEKMQIPEAGSN